MDLIRTTETFTSSDWRWLASSKDVAHAHTVTIATADLVQTHHYPDGYLKSGLLLAQYTSGGNSGLWGIYTDDAIDGRETALAILLDEPRVQLDSSGAVAAARIACAALWSAQVYVGNIPEHLLADGTTANTINAADLPAGIVDIVQ